MSSTAELLGPTLVGKDGNVATAEALTGIDVVGLYFSAHWCPPCRGFTPVLGKKYEELKKAGKAFELVFISKDQNAEAFTEYHATMPFLGLPFADRERAQSLNAKFGVSGIPSLVLVDAKTGTVITKNGRSALSSDTVVADYPFTPKAMYDLAENTDGIDSDPSFLLLLDGCSQEVKAALSATLLSIASAELKLPEQGRRVQHFFTGKSDVDQVRTNCGVEGSPTFVILDLAKQGAFYKPEGKVTEVTEASITEFMDAFKAGNLQRGTWGKVPLPAITFPTLLGPVVWENPERAPQEPWTCGACTFSNAGNSKQCDMCGTPKPNQQQQPQQWACAACTFLNEASAAACQICGTPNPSAAAEPEHKDVDTKTFAGKYLGLYFSAHWCPPCRGFTPVLAQWYKTHLPENMDVVFISSDRDVSQFAGYFEEMPWKAVPYNSPVRQAISKRFDVKSLPTFLILGPDGKVVCKDGRSAITSNPTGFPWADPQ